MALELLSHFESLGGLGIAAPSANRFGHVSPTSAHHVQIELGEYLSGDDLILDGGQSDIGIESTIIDCRNPCFTILRPGAITLAMIHSVIKSNFEATQPTVVRVSGDFEKHYAPNAKVLINEAPKRGQAFMALSPIETPEGVHRISSPANIVEFAQNLYAVMRKTDDLGFEELVVQLPDGEGLEVALLDRLRKAANGR
jgi:L-threonylcarbamoyladenylate synthase